MYYLVELKDLNDGYTDQITVKPSMRLDHFADEVRRTMGLPFDDMVPYRKTYCNGYIYMPEDSIYRHVENLWQGGDYPDDMPDPRKSDIYKETTYKAEENTRLTDLFNSTGSSFKFEQGRDEIRCTLVKKIEGDCK